MDNVDLFQLLLKLTEKQRDPKIIERSSELPTTKDRLTPLMLSIKHDSKSIFDYLISLKVDINTLDEHGNDALHHALLVRDSPISRELL